MSRNPSDGFSTSLWLCSVLAVASMSVNIGCLWCCICAMAWIADCECVNMTIIVTHGGYGLSRSLEMICKSECRPIAFIEWEPRTCIHVKRAKMCDPVG